LIYKVYLSLYREGEELRVQTLFFTAT